MSGNNGDNPRLDRIENIIEVMPNVQRDMQQDLQVLLRAQVVLGEKVDKLADEHKALSQETDARFRDTDERLGALIKIVDELIRRPGGLA